MYGNIKQVSTFTEINSERIIYYKSANLFNIIKVDKSGVGKSGHALRA